MCVLDTWYSGKGSTCFRFNVDGKTLVRFNAQKDCVKSYGNLATFQFEEDFKQMQAV